jgi:hypothetical protein
MAKPRSNGCRRDGWRKGVARGAKWESRLFDWAANLSDKVLSQSLGHHQALLKLCTTDMRPLHGHTCKFP